MGTRASGAHAHGESAHHRHDDGTHMLKFRQGTGPCRRGSCHTARPSGT